MYSPHPGRCDGCAGEGHVAKMFLATNPNKGLPLWMLQPAIMSCAPCEIELCQECHDTKHKLHCDEPPELYSTEYFFHPEIGA